MEKTQVEDKEEINSSVAAALSSSVLNEALKDPSNQTYENENNDFMKTRKCN